MSDITTAEHKTHGRRVTHQLAAMRYEDKLTEEATGHPPLSMITSWKRWIKTHNVLPILHPATMTRILEALPSGSTLCRSMWNHRRLITVTPFLLSLLCKRLNWRATQGIHKGAALWLLNFSWSAPPQLGYMLASNFVRSGIVYKKRLQQLHNVKMSTTYSRGTRQMRLLPKLLLIWCPSLSHPTVRRQIIQKFCGINRYEAMESKTSMCWSVYLLKPYASWCATVWGLTGSKVPCTTGPSALGNVNVKTTTAVGQSRHDA